MSLTNWLPLSVIIRLGIPNLVTMLRTRNFFAAAAIIRTTGSTSIHLVNVSMATNKNIYPLGASGSGPTISMLQVEKGHDKGMVCNA